MLNNASSLSLVGFCVLAACAAEPGRRIEAHTGASVPVDTPRIENAAPVGSEQPSQQVGTAGSPPAKLSAGSGAVEHPCAGVAARAVAKLLPTDVIWAIDTSGSMAGSFPAIQQALREFSRKVVDAGIDAHIVLLAGANGGRLSTTGLCVPSPLGSGQCGSAANSGAAPARADDSREPTFLHLDTPFGADQGMAVLLDNHPAYKQLLRVNARTQLVLTEDGAPPMATKAVIDHLEGRASATQLPAWTPGLVHGNWAFNGVVCANGWAGLGCILGFQVPTTTLELISTSGGVVADLGNAGVEGQDPFAELLDRLAKNVIVNAQISCEYQIPAAPMGMTFDATQVNVVYTDGAGRVSSLPRVADALTCSDARAWRYDDLHAPSQVQLCPTACALVQQDPGARIDVEFGCSSVILEPS